MDDEDDVFVSLEGIDGTGKTGVAKMLDDELKALGIEHLVTHDPPAIRPWNGLKTSVLNKQTEVSPLAEAMLYFAGRLDNISRYIIPALEAGRVVISDRFTDSWIAYQTPRLARLFGSREAAMKWLLEFSHSFLTHRLYVAPTKTYLLIDDPKEAVRRAARKGPTKWEKVDLLRKVQRIYLTLAKKEPRRFEVYDIRGRPLKEAIDEVVQDATQYIGQRVRL